MNHVKAIFLIPLALGLLIIGNILSSMLIFWIAPTGKVFFEKLFLGMVSILPLLGVTVLLGFYIQRQLMKWSARWAGLGLLVCLGLFIILFIFAMITRGGATIYQYIINILLLLGTVYGVYGTWKENPTVDE